jgi:hypothetical protein
MPYVHDLKLGRWVSARYWRESCDTGMPRYHQLDEHSCGFLAALAVIHHFAPQTPARKVLKAVAPSSTTGCDWRHLVRCLKSFGIAVTSRRRLGLRSLHHLLERRAVAIVTVWPEWSPCDHWSALRHVDVRRRRVFLSNYRYGDPDGGLGWDAFRALWCPRGEALLCLRAFRGCCRF